MAFTPTMARSAALAATVLLLLSSLLAMPAFADDPPARPQALSATAEDHAIRLRWYAAWNTTNESLQGYRVYLVEGGARTAIGNTTPNQTEYLDAPLPYDVTRTYEVTAVALDGRESAPSFNATAMTAMPPGAPRDLRAYGLTASIVLAWSPPDEGGEAVGYQVWRGTSPDAKSWIASTTQTWFNDSFLDEGVTYHYQVRAYNMTNYGTIEGPYSNEASNRTGRLPSEPRNLTATGGLGRIDLAWEPPADDGGSAVSYYVYRGNDSWLTLIGETNGTTYADEPLSNLTTHSYRVSAANSLGEGPSAGPVSASTTGAPGMPAWMTLTGLDHAIRIDWGRPYSIDPALLAGYRVHAGDSADNLTLLAETGPDASNHTDAPLPYGVTRFYQVSAFAVTGAEGERTPVQWHTTAEPPSEPRNVTATASPGAIRVSWLRPATGDGALGYVVFVATSGNGPYDWLASTASTSFDHAGLPPNATRHYKVQAMNEVAGPLSAPASATTPSLPGAPQDLRVAAGARSLTLTWSPPATDGGAAITAYRVYRGNTSANQSYLATVNATATSYVDTPLPDAATRHYRVSAVTAVGEGPRSDVAANVTYGPPSAPRDLAASAGNGTVRLTWSAPLVANGTTSTRIFRDSGSGFILVGSVPAGNLTWTDASPPKRANLTYVARAANLAGESPASNGATAWLPDAPSAPRNLTASGLSKVTLRWDAPADDGGLPLQTYRIYRAVDGGAATLLAEQPASDRDYVDRACPLASQCAYRVAAVNGAGEGTRSNEATKV